MGVRALDRQVPRGRQGRMRQAQRADDASGDLAPPRAAGDAVDDQAEQVVFRVGVGVRRSGREHRRLGGREVEDLGDRPDVRGMTRGVLVLCGQVPFRDPAAVAEQHPDRDVGRGREAADDVRRQHLGEPRIERQPAALDELQHDDRDERLHDAPGPEAITGPHRHRRRHTAEAGDAGPAAELRAAHVQDPSRGVHARIVQRAAQHPLELTREGRVKARADRAASELACRAARAGSVSPAATSAPAAPTSSVRRSMEPMAASSATGLSSTSGVPSSFRHG